VYLWLRGKLEQAKLYQILWQIFNMNNANIQYEYLLARKFWIYIYIYIYIYISLSALSMIAIYRETISGIFQNQIDMDLC